MAFMIPWITVTNMCRQVAWSWARICSWNRMIWQSSIAVSAWILERVDTENAIVFSLLALVH